MEPLSTTMTSPPAPRAAIPARAASITWAMEASSLRQGMTTLTPGSAGQAAENGPLGARSYALRAPVVHLDLANRLLVPCFFSTL